MFFWEKEKKMEKIQKASAATLAFYSKRPQKQERTGGLVRVAGKGIFRVWPCF